MFCVYLITRDDELQYIGKTVLKKVKYRIQQHSKSRKLKGHSFTYEILCVDEDHDVILERETYFIKLYNTFQKGLNNTPDGKAKNNTSYSFTTLGFKMTEETKEKIRQKTIQNGNHNFAHEAVRNDPELKARIKAKLSESRKGKRWGPLTFDEFSVREILKLYVSKPDITVPDELKSSRSTGDKIFLRNGLPLNYEWLFAKTFAPKYGMTPNHLKNLITGKYLSWNALYEEIAISKS